MMGTRRRLPIVLFPPLRSLLLPSPATFTGGRKTRSWGARHVPFSCVSSLCQALISGCYSIRAGKVALGLDMLSYILLPRWRHVLVDFVTTTGWRAVTPPTAPPGSCRHSSSSCAPILSTMSAKHHPDLVMCRKQPGISVGRLCERCDGKCVVCDSHTRPTTIVRVCDECTAGSLAGRCVTCGAAGVSDAYYQIGRAHV